MGLFECLFLFLAVCYCAKSIKGAVNLELTSLASTYFRKSEDFLRKNLIKELHSHNVT